MPAIILQHAHDFLRSGVGTDRRTQASARIELIDPYQRVFGHPGLHVVDGAAVTANLGVNPALTITAQAERALALWPNRGQPDPRPELAAAYRQVSPVTPQHPVVPPSAPAALRLPIIDVTG